MHSAWEDIQRAQRQAAETQARFERMQLTHRHSEADREEMESTLLDVAADLENLARNYRQHGSPAMAVPLYVSALAIFEKTLGSEHPQVASNLVNLGNAFCDQQKHIEAVPVYLRALAIDEKALGHDHPEACRPQPHVVTRSKRLHFLIASTSLIRSLTMYVQKLMVLTLNLTNVIRWQWICPIWASHTAL